MKVGNCIKETASSKALVQAEASGFTLKELFAILGFNISQRRFGHEYLKVLVQSCINMCLQIQLQSINQLIIIQVTEDPTNQQSSFPTPSLYPPIAASVKS